MKRRKRWLSLTLASAGLCALLCALGYAAADKGLSKDTARKAIARVAGLELKPNQVNVKDISTIGPTATVVADVETAFRLVKGARGEWRVAEIRTGDRRWEDVDLLVRALNNEKSARARAELDALATALEAFRRERGFYVIADTEAALLDQLNPRYTPAIIRLDPWQHPYAYEGTRAAYVLRSLGADGKANTADDVVVSKG